ncbi:hypothetical protein J2S53_001791 [Actinopolyspora lacussalsi]|nr:hypothetical protein [Actinopolyspora lacussalsi]
MASSRTWTRIVGDAAAASRGFGWPARVETLAETAITGSGGSARYFTFRMR